MSTPHDFRSLWRGKSTFEVKNVDSVTLPAFTPVEVTAADSIEADSRTIVHVTRPSVASLDPDKMCILGPMEITSGSYGTATIDYPCYARYTGSPANGELWGTTVNGTQLDTAQFGFVIWGDPTGDVVKINKADQGSRGQALTLIRAVLSGDMCSDDGTGTINTVEFLSTGIVTVAPTTAGNGLKLAGTAGDIIYAAFRPSTGLWEILNVQHVRNTYLEKMVEPTEITGGQIPSLTTALTQPSDPGCDYKFRKLQTPMIKEPIGTCIQEAFDEINFTPCVVLTNLNYGQNSTGDPTIEGRLKVIWVPDQCDEVPQEWVDLLMGIECPTPP
jgi:hypothetical protein